MELSLFFKSIVDADNMPVVICGVDNKILYLNPTARERYKKHGDLTGRSIFDCHNDMSNEKIRRVVQWFRCDVSHNRVFTFHNGKNNEDVYMIALRNESGELIGYYEKHESRVRDSGKEYDLF